MSLVRSKACRHPDLPGMGCVTCIPVADGVVQDVTNPDPPRTPGYYIGVGNLHASDVIDAFGLNGNWRMASAVSYALRCGRKGGNDDAIRDLEKAIHFLQSELAFRQGKRGKDTMEIGK